MNLNMNSVKSDMKHNSLYDRVNKLLVSYEWSDCNFHVCGQEFKAHKLILAISSPVFEAMLYGPLSTKDSIAITDINANIFQLLLNYIYTDRVDIPSIEDAFELLYVANKYLLETLTQICLEYIQSNTSIDNVVHILNYPEFLLDNELVTWALKLFCQHAHHLIEEHKHDISIACWKKVLETSEINIKEKDLIKMLFAWSYFYAKKYNISTEATYRREILVKTGLFKLLRFLTLSIDDLDSIVHDKFNLLLPDEILDIKDMITNMLSNNKAGKLNDQLHVVTVPREAIEIKWLLCHRASIKSEPPITIDSNNYCIQSKLKADKTLFLHSLKIQSRMAPANNFCNTLNIYNEDFIISVMSETDRSIINEFEFKQKVEYDRCLDIKFLQPLCIRKDQSIKISFTWPHLSMYDTHLYSVQSRDLSCALVYNSKIHFEFHDIPSISNTGGSFLKGIEFCM